MATTNVSEDEEQNHFGKYTYCALDKATVIHGNLIFIAVLNAFLSIMAFLGNVLVLVALRKDSSLHTPSKLLLCSLAVTDLCAGLFLEPLYVTLLVTVVNEHWNICRYVALTVTATGTILACASLLTLTAISVDRLLALLLRLRYRQVVTLKRASWIVITFWVLSAGYTTARLFLNIIPIFGGIVISLCLVTSTFSHTKIFLTLRSHQSQVQDHVQQPNQTNQLNIARFRKAVSTALWLQLALIVCYLPQGISENLISKTELSSSFTVAYSYTATLVFFNSSLNPILNVYCWKIADVRQAIKDTIRQILCC